MRRFLPYFLCLLLVGSIATAAYTPILQSRGGGTGQTSYTIGDLLYASGTTTLSKLAAVASGQVLRSAGTSTAPAWGALNLGTDVGSSILPIANGGTGATTGAPVILGTLASTSLGAVGSGTESTTIAITSTATVHVQIEELVDNVFEWSDCSSVMDGLSSAGGYGSAIGVIQSRKQYPFEYTNGALNTGMAEAAWSNPKYFTWVFGEAVAATSIALQAGPDNTTKLPTAGAIEWSLDGSTSWTEAATFTGLSWSADQIQSLTSWSSPGAKKGWRLKVTAVGSGGAWRFYPSVRLLGTALWMGPTRANGIVPGVVWEQTSATLVTIRNTLPYARNVRAVVTD